MHFLAFYYTYVGFFIVDIKAISVKYLDNTLEISPVEVYNCS